MYYTLLREFLALLLITCEWFFSLVINRAASCRYLTTCIKQRTTTANVVDKLDELFDIMMELLEREQDTFVYLSVVRALSEITNVKPQVNKRNGWDMILRYILSLIEVIKFSTNLCAVKIYFFSRFFFRFFERIFDAFKAQVFLTKQNEAILMKLGEVVMRCIKELGKFDTFL